MNSREYVVACFALVVVFLLAFSAYWPNVSSQYVFDDAANLEPLEKLRNAPEHLRDAVTGNSSGYLGRPISMTSFALAAIYSEDLVKTTKYISILLHLSIGALVLRLFYLLFRVHGNQSAFSLSLISVSIWLLAPMHVSTVLYAVQQMAMLSCLFVVLSILLYVEMRVAKNTQNKVLFALFCVLAIVAAPFAKENGVIALPLIVLIEVFWLQEPRSVIRDPAFERAARVFLISGFVAALLMLAHFWDWILQGYDHRKFTLPERLLTESRVLWHYIGQHYFPHTGVMGVLHDDFAVSSSIRSPDSTLYSVLAWALLICASVFSLIVRKFMALACVVLCFLIAHSIESTFLALEIYFEHRNYLPSVFISLMPALIVGSLPQRIVEEVRLPALAAGSMYILFLAFNTSALAVVWRDVRDLNIHSIVGHPKSQRANSYMASDFAVVGDFPTAREYSEAAHQSGLKNPAAREERDSDYRLRNVALACIAQHAVPEEDVRRLGTINRERPIAEWSVIMALGELIQRSQCPGYQWGVVSDRLAEVYLDAGSEAVASAGVYQSLASLENDLENYERASRYASLALKLSPNDATLLLMQLHFLLNLGFEEQAELVLGRLRDLATADELTLFQRQTLDLYLR